MKLKNPLIIDSAYNNYGSDWSHTPLDGMYCKATEGYYTEDIAFADTWKQMKELGKPRAAYHFYREKWYGIPRDPVIQARHFFDVVNKHGFYEGDRLVLDAEDSKMTIQGLLAFGRECHDNLFGVWPWLYTGFYKTIDDITGYEKLTDADIDDLKKMGVIIAFYPSDPDVYSSLPSQYVPNPLYYGEVIGWQYAGDMPQSFTGVKGRLDYNVFSNLAMQSWKTAPVPPPPDTPPTPDVPPVEQGSYILTPGTVENVNGEPTNYYTVKVNLADIEIVCDNTLNFMTTDQWRQKTGCSVAINGPTGWYISQQKRRPVVIPDGLAFYHGRSYLSSKTIALNLYLDPMNVPSLVRPSVIYNACGFPNILVKDGVIQPISKSVQDIRARTAIGFDKSRTVMFLFVCDGGDYWEKHGMNFQQVAQILLDLGCDLVIMGDGGGSTTMVRADNQNNTLVVGKPCGEEVRVIGGTTFHMRPVPFHFGFRSKV